MEYDKETLKMMKLVLYNFFYVQMQIQVHMLEVSTEPLK